MKNLFGRGMGALILPAVLLVLSGACVNSGDTEPGKGGSNSMVIMTWNMQALFDGVDDGNEYDEYRAEAGWSKEKYSGRLSAISKAVGDLDTVPDIIAVQEAESALVITDLANSLSKHGYNHTHFAQSPEMSLGLGVLSRFPVQDAKVHSINADGTAAPRPVLEVRIDVQKALSASDHADSSALVLFICHWKSKLGGEDLTEKVRRSSARIILRRIRELAAQEPSVPVVVMGDLNENHDEFYRKNGASICALVPDDPRSAELAGLHISGGVSAADERQQDFIVISKHKPPVTRHFSGQPVALYSPWAAELKNGSYRYRNAWETIDHFLLSTALFNNTGWEFDNCTAANSPPFTNSSGYPAAYNPRTGFGLSDHLPLLLFLRWKGGE